MSAAANASQRGERNAGMLLIASALVALLLANSPLATAWHDLIAAPLGLRLPRIGMLTPHGVVSDGLMAIFFLLVGLEVKREWYDGRLASREQRRLPLIAAAAGMAVPALVYLAATGFAPALRHGWAIPSATDIAFAIGVLALLGPRAPPALKLLLVTIAIADDIGAVLIIALAYTRSLDPLALGAAVVIVAAMAGLSRLGVRRLWPYLIGFAALWLAVLASGIHATIAGVLAAFVIPLAKGERHSPLRHLEHAIHPWVMFVVVPLFGLVSAGVSLGGASLLDPLPLGIALGLFVGKQAGVFAAIRVTVSVRGAAMPGGLSWRHIYGAALLCGIGFTMSLFIAALAFEDPALADQARLGTLAGSLMSALAGYAVLRGGPATARIATDDDEAERLFAADEDREHGDPA